MKLSFKQALVMLDVMKESLKYNGTFGGYTLAIRQMIVKQVLNQQSDDLVNIEPENIVWDWEYLEEQNSDGEDISDGM